MTSKNVNNVLNVIYVSFNKVFSATSGLAIIFLLDLYYGSNAVGLYSTLYASIAILSTVAIFGANNLIIYFVNISSRARSQSIVGHAFKASLLAFVFAAPFYAIYALNIDLPVESHLVIATVLVGAFIKMLMEYWSALYRALGKPVKGVIFDSSVRPLLVILFILGLSLIEAKLELILPVIILSLLFTFIISTISFRADYGAINFSSFKLTLIRNGLFRKTTLGRSIHRKLKHFFILNLSQVLSRQFDILVLAMYVTTSQVAFYAIGAKVSGIVLYVFMAAASVIGPQLSAARNKSKAVVNECFYRSNIIVLWFVLGITPIIYFVGPSLIIKVFGTEYFDAIQVIQLLVLFELFTALLGNCGVAMNMLGFSEQNSRIFIGFTMAQGIGMLVLGSLFGLMGVAWAAGVGRLSYRFTLLIFLTKKGFKPSIFNNLIDQMLKWKL